MWVGVVRERMGELLMNHEECAKERIMTPQPYEGDVHVPDEVAICRIFLHMQPNDKEIKGNEDAC